MTDVFNQGTVLLLGLGLLLALVAYLHCKVGLRGGLDPRLFSWLEFWRDQLGTFAVTYTSAFPGNGTSTAPTAVQARQLRIQTAIVSFADADTTGTVVHNWGAAGVLGNSFASYEFPAVWMIQLLATASPSSFATDFTFGLSNSNQITINKTSIGTGSGGSWAVYMLATADALL